MTAAFKLGTALLELRTDDKALDQGLKDARSKVTNELNKTQGDVAKIGGGISGMIGRFFAGAAVGQTVAILGDMVKSAREEQVEISRLSQAVENAGVSWSEYGTTIERVIAARQRLAYSDSVLRDSLSILINMTGSVSRALQLQATAADLARGKNISLAEASTIVGKVATGNIGILARQGIVVAKNATVQEALDAISARFAGNAERYAATSEAAAERQANAFANLRETAGGAIEGILPIVANAATTWSGFGHGGILAAGAIATFAKAGAGTIPILTGLRNGITFLGVALKGLFLNPIGLAILAIAALAIGLKILYDHSARFREIVNAIGRALIVVFGPILQAAGAVLGWVGDRLGDLARMLGMVGDAADENLAGSIPDGATEAVDAIKSIGDATTELRDKFKPAGATETADFLKALGVNQEQIDQVLDTIYDTVGASVSTRFKKITDDAYAKLQPDVQKAIMGPAEEQAAIVKKGGQALVDAARESNQTVKQYIAESEQKTKDAEARLELWTKGVASAINSARARGQVELAEAAAAQRLTEEITRVHDLRLAWDDARNAATLYSGAVLGGSAGGPRATPTPGPTPQPGPPPRPGGVSIVQTNHFAGGGTAELADAMEAATVDGVTEAFRQQSRRLASA